MRKLPLILLIALTTPLLAQPEHADIIAAQQLSKHVQAWRRYSFIGIPKVQTPPTVDGEVNAREWTAAAAVGHVLHMAEGMQVNDRAVWRICYTDTHLYLAFQFDRPESARAPSARDFAEFLFDIEHDHHRYHNIGLSIDKELWSGIGPNVDKTAWTPKYDYKARLTPTGWEGEWSVAFTEFKGHDGAPAPGTVWGVDLVRNERTPTDRIAQWAWRGTWAACKDLAHVMFTGQPVAVRAEQVGWIPEHKKMGVKLAVSNFSNKPVTLDAALDLRRAERDLTMQFLPALDSAFTEDLSAAIGVQIDEEISRALEPFKVIAERNEPVEIPANASKQIELTLPDEPGNYLVGYKLDRDGNMLAGTNVPFVVTVPLNLTLASYLYSADVLGYTVDLRRVQDRIDAETSLKVVARLGKDGPVIAEATHTGITGKETVEAEFNFEPQSAATYFVTAELIQAGEQVALNSVPLILPEKAEWIDGDAGRSKIVPKPWHDLRADVKHTDTLVVDYTWTGDSIFPRVKVKDKAIFTRPMRFDLKDGDGNPIILNVTDFTYNGGDAENVTYRFTADAGAAGTLSGTINVAFDGFLWYDLTLTPGSSSALSSLIFSAQLKPEHSRIYTRGRVAAGEGDYTIPGTDCGAIPAEGIAMPYTFQTWVGYVEGGLQWYCENARNWFNEDPKTAVRIDPSDDGATLSVRYVDRKITVDKPLDWHFGLMPTPSKTKVGGPEDHAYYQGSTGGIDKPDDALEETNPNRYKELMRSYDLVHGGYKERGVKAIILWTYYNDWFGFPGLDNPEKEDRLRRFVSKMHSQGIKVLVYNGWGMSTEAPDWEQYGTELVNLPLKNSGYNTYWGSPASLYADLFIHRMKEHMAEFDLDGIYMDSTLGVNYSEHPNGMRWTDEKGRMRGSYPVRAQRDFAMRIYKVLNHELGKDGIFYSHHSPTANACIENFVNVRCPSEYAQFYQGPLDQAFVDFFLAKNGGIQFGYHTELTNKNWMRSIHKSLNELNAIAVPAGVSFKTVSFVPWVGDQYGRMDQPQSRIWKTFQWLDTQNATHYPWWSDDHLLNVSPSDGTLSSVWLRKGEKAIICLSNLPAESRDITATLNLGAMGFKAVQIEDAYTGEAVEVNGNTFTAAVQEQRYRLLKVWAK